jgi:hypothetical protein
MSFNHSSDNHSSDTAFSNLSKDAVTGKPSDGTNNRTKDENDAKHPTLTADYYIALIAEERQGKPLATPPLRLLAQCPGALGRSVGDLLKRRFQIANENLLQKIPRLKMVMAELRDTYLVVRLEPPLETPNHLHPKKRREQAFNLFYTSLQAAVALPKPTLIIRRRRPDPSVL